MDEELKEMIWKEQVQMIADVVFKENKKIITAQFDAGHISHLEQLMANVGLAKVIGEATEYLSTKDMCGEDLKLATGFMTGYLMGRTHH